MQFKNVHTFGGATLGQRNAANTGLIFEYNREGAKWCMTGLSSCMIDDVAHPLDADFAQLPSQSWAVVKMSDFDGKFEAKGVSIAKGAGGKRKKPSLIEFKSTPAEYAEECKDDVTPGSGSFDLAKMNKIGLALPGNNPCNKIAGKWTTIVTYKQTNQGPVEETEYEKQGAAWIADDVGKDSTREAGMTAKQVHECDKRRFNRRKEDDNWNRIFDIINNVEDKIHFTAITACEFIPSFVTAPEVPLSGFLSGVGIVIQAPAAICDFPVDKIHFAFGVVQSAINDALVLGQEKRLMDDCETTKDGMNRMFCDMWCIRDAARMGDKAILGSLEEAVATMGMNADALLEYYTGGVADGLKEIQQDQKKQNKELLLEKVHDTKGRLSMIVTEMRGMLAGNLHPGSHTTVTRALDAFSSRFSSVPISGLANSSAFMDEFSSEAAKLLSTVRTSSTSHVSTVGTIAHRATSFLRTTNAFVKSQHSTLGVYHASALEKRANKLSLAGMDSNTLLGRTEVLIVQKTAVDDLIMNFDRSWWKIREKLDAYLEAALSQTAAYDDAVSVLDRYTSRCSADMRDLSKAQTRAIQANDAAKTQLHDTWQVVVNELGLVAATVVDSGGFMQLSSMDAASVDLEPQRSTICKGGSAARDAARSSIMKGLQSGLLEKTWQQFVDIFGETRFLLDRFEDMEMPEPYQKTLLQTIQRTTDSLKEAQSQHGDLVLEMTSHICHPERDIVEGSQEQLTSPSSQLDKRYEQMKKDHEIFQAYIQPLERNILLGAVLGVGLAVYWYYKQA